MLGRLATEAVENGAEDIVNQAVTTGRVDPKSALAGMVPGLGAASRKSGGASKVSGGLTSAVNLNPVSVASGAGCPTGPPGRRHSFEPSTKVLMADGSQRPISDLNIGDKVRAMDPVTGKTSAQPVTLLHRNVDTDMTRLTVKDKTGRESVLNTTQHHPFWNATDKRWTDAKDLRAGDRLKVTGLVDVSVTEVRNYESPRPMRDLTVDLIHTYYVLAGNKPVLVHNSNRRCLEEEEVRNRPGLLSPDHEPIGDPDAKGEVYALVAPATGKVMRTGMAVNLGSRRSDHEADFRTLRSLPSSRPILVLSGEVWRHCRELVDSYAER